MIKIISIISVIFVFRPPPKMARRVAPAPETPPPQLPTTIVETPPSPSMTTFGHNANNSHPAHNNQSTYSSDSNVKPSDILRQKKYVPPPNVIAKSAQNSSSESLINSTNNEETLHVESYPISERVRINLAQPSIKYLN